MKFYNTIKRVAGGLFLAAAFSVAGNSVAQDTLVALGSVNSTPALVNSRNTVNGTVSVSNGGVGDAEITIDAVGAFAGAAENDFIIEVVTQHTIDSDDTAAAEVLSLTADQLVVTVRTQDVESAGAPNDPTQTDYAFYFVIRRVPNGASAIDGSSRFMLATATISAGGTINSGFAPEGFALSTAGPGAGTRSLVISKTGEFAGDAASDYVVMVSSRATGLQDQVPEVQVGSVVSDDEVVVTVNTADVQANPSASSGDPESEDFFITVYRLDFEGEGGNPKTKNLAALGHVSSAGSLLAGGTSIPGGIVASTNGDTGEYEVTVNALGEFAGKDARDYTVQISIEDDTATDIFAIAQSVIDNDNTLRVQIFVNDVEEDGHSAGVPINKGFFIAIYDSNPNLQTDLHIGTKRSLSKMKGDGVINTSGAGQGIKVSLPGTAQKRFFFAIQNDGQSVENYRLKHAGAGKIVRLKYFRLSGGRANVTAAVRKGLAVAEDVRPGKHATFQAKVRYASLNKTPKRKVRLTGTSEFGATSDTVRAKTVAQN